MDVEALLSPPGSVVLDRACREYVPGGELALIERLRRTYDAGLVATAVGQAALRHRATAKFGTDAERMLFTQDGLEQATRPAVARHRAGRIATGKPGASIVDLGCGIGGDLIAFARAGLDVTGVEQDPGTARIAEANLQSLDLPGRVHPGDAENQDLAAYDVVYADPARRADGRRIFDPAAYRPPWSFVLELLTRTAVVKIAPGIPHDAIPEGVEAEWVSENGQVKEAVLWSGDLATGVRRRATLLPSGTMVTEQDAPEADTGPVGQYIYEPDGAVIRAGLVTAVAVRVGGRLLDPRIAYVTSDVRRHSTLASAYEVVEQLPYQEKALRSWVRSADVGTLEIKKRGVDLDPAVLRKRLAPKGSRPATLIVTRIGSDAVAYACRRLSTRG